MKRSSKHLKYTPSRRRWNLDATSFGPALKLALALVLLAAFVLLTIYVIVPLISARLQNGGSLFSGEQTASVAQETAEPKNPILTNTVKTVQYGEGYGLPTAVVDPSVYDGKILFATGADENACDRFVRLNPETGAFENIEAERTNSTMRSPVENAEVLIYTDVKSTGGGTIRMIDKTTRENTALAEFSMGAPKLSLEAPYLVWMERTGDASAKLMVCDITSGELLTLAVFTDSTYADSAPSLKSGQVLYADADEANPGSGLIRTVLLSDNSRWDFAAGSYVHDPESAGDRWAYLTGNHDGESDLYVSVGGGSPMRVARGVIDFDITPTCVVFSRDETVYAYVFSDNKTYVLSETGTNSQFVMASGDYALWRDMTDPENPLWKYIKVM
ncbi:MAG: hypothetical protein ABFC31_12795 [Clostridiaceae bacterium]